MNSKNSLIQYLRNLALGLFGKEKAILSGFNEVPEKFRISITFDGPVHYYFVRFYDEVPIQLSIDSLFWRPGDKALGSGNRIFFSEETLQPSNEYSVVVYSVSIKTYWKNTIAEIFHRQPREFLAESAFEIVRQPSQWLKENFDLDVPMGHSILGRRNIDVKVNDTDVLPDIEVVGGAKIPEEYITSANLKFDSSVPNEIKIASAAISYLWSKRIHVGPSKVPYDEFLGKNIDEKLNSIEAGEASTMCQGMRDLFLHFMADPTCGVKARAAEAYNYYPPFEGLQTYGHSTSEIYIESESRFILVDAWAGFALKSRGKWVSADDISFGTVKACEIEIFELVPETKLHYLGENSKARVDIGYPKEMKMDAVCLDSLVHIPGYFTYFGMMKYHNLVIADNFLVKNEPQK